MSLNPQNLGNGEEQHEMFTIRRAGRPGKKMCQYDYRHTDGDLFTCVAPSVQAARERRDEWFKAREGAAS